MARRFRFDRSIYFSYYSIPFMHESRKGAAAFDAKIFGQARIGPVLVRRTGNLRQHFPLAAESPYLPAGKCLPHVPLAAATLHPPAGKCLPHVPFAAATPHPLAGKCLPHVPLAAATPHPPAGKCLPHVPFAAGETPSPLPHRRSTVTLTPAGMHTA